MKTEYIIELMREANIIYDSNGRMNQHIIDEYNDEIIGGKPAKEFFLCQWNIYLNSMPHLHSSFKKLIDSLIVKYKIKQFLQNGNNTR